MKRLYLIVNLSLFALQVSAANTPEDVFWQSVNKTDLAEEYRLYVEQFPKGKYVAEAWRRIGRLEAIQEGKAKPPKPPEQNALIAGRYRDNGDGTVTDVTTKLQWMRCAVGQTWSSSSCQGSASKHNWNDANTLRSNVAGYSDWRLPMIEELKSLVYCSSGEPMTWNNSGNRCEGGIHTRQFTPKHFPIPRVRMFGRVRPSPAVRATRGTFISTMATPTSTSAATTGTASVSCAADSDFAHLHKSRRWRDGG